MAALSAEEPDVKRPKGGESLGELMYFPLWAKGLQLALCAEASGLSWEGTTPQAQGGWPVVKATGITPFGQLPILKTPGGMILGQSAAIANYIAKKGGIDGASDEEFALGQMLIAEGEDIYTLCQKHELARWKKPEVRSSMAEERKVLFAETIPLHLSHLEKLCVVPKGFTSSGSTAGELYLWGMLMQAMHCSETGADALLDKTPKLKAWYEATAAHPAVTKVLAGKSAMGDVFNKEQGPYFLNDADFAAFTAKSS